MFSKKSTRGEPLVRTICLVILFYVCRTVSSQELELKEFEVLANGDLLLENFEKDSVGRLPADWLNRDGDSKPATYLPAEKAKYRYQVQVEDGNRFLRYGGRDARHLNLPLKNSKHINIYETPVLSWRWRAWHLPEGANEDKNSKNDTALSVYVVFKISGFIIRRPETIRYTWSTSLAKGSVLNKGKQKIVVLESGEDKLGEWLQFERNIVQDYRDFFGKEPPARPIALLILSDANSTKTSAQGDYDDFMLKKARAAE